VGRSGGHGAKRTCCRNWRPGAAETGDRVLFSPDDRYEVEVGGQDYIMLRERDIHAVAATRIEASTGLYI